jgi:hypothetical protein
MTIDMTTREWILLIVLLIFDAWIFYGWYSTRPPRK